MIEWPLLVASGLLGSAHCLGMCGPFALAIGSRSSDWRDNMRRQACYSVGRIFTYAVLGAAAAFAVNAVSYVPLLGALFRWRPNIAPRTAPREEFLPAVNARRSTGRRPEIPRRWRKPRRFRIRPCPR